MPEPQSQSPAASPLPNSEREKIALSVAAKMCSVDYDTFLRWVMKGVIPHVTIGPFNRKRVYRDDVEALIRAGEVA